MPDDIPQVITLANRGVDLQEAERMSRRVAWVLHGTKCPHDKVPLYCASCEPEYQDE